MANNIKGITIEIGGETTKLSKALAGVNSDIKTTQGQLKEVEKLLKLDPTNVELLRQKQVLMAQATEEAAAKLKTLKEAEQQLKNAGVDENSEQFMALKREIIATEQQMNKAGDAAADNAKETKKQGEAAEDAEKKNSALGTALGATGAAFAAAAAAAAAAAVKVAGAMTDMTKQGAEYADNILTEATVTGLSTERLQEFAYASELVDVSTETLTGSMRRNIMSMKNAAKGSAEVADAYERLGVAVTDDNGELRDSETVYFELIDALGSIENETERDALAMTLLGKSAQDLNPLIAAGSARLNELAQEAHAAGYVMGEEQLNAFGAFDDNMQYLTNGVTAAKNAIGGALLPVLTELSGDGVDLLNQFTNAIISGDGDIETIIENIANLIPEALERVKEYLPRIIDIVGTVLSSALSALADVLPDLIPIFKQLVEQIATIILNPEILSVIIDAAVEIALATIETIIEILPDLIDKLGPVIREALGKLSQRLPDIMSTFFGIIKKNFVKNIELMGDIWDLLVKGAKIAWDGIKNVFGKVGDFFSDVFSKAWEKIKGIFSKGGQMFEGIKDGVSDVFKGIVNGLIKGINAVIAVPFKAINKALDKIRGIKLFGTQPFANLIEEIKVPEIPMLAKGGTVSSGMAIVGEAGPELLTVSGGSAHVQPLTARIDSGDLAALAGNGTNVNIEFTGSLAQLARILQPAIRVESGRQGNSLIKGVI